MATMKHTDAENQWAVLRELKRDPRVEQTAVGVAARSTAGIEAVEDHLMVDHDV